MKLHKNSIGEYFIHDGTQILQMNGIYYHKSLHELIKTAELNCIHKGKYRHGNNPRYANCELIFEFTTRKELLNGFPEYRL